MASSQSYPLSPKNLRRLLEDSFGLPLPLLKDFSNSVSSISKEIGITPEQLRDVLLVAVFLSLTEEQEHLQEPEEEY